MSFPVPKEYDMPNITYNNGDVITLPPSVSGDGTGVNLSQLEKDLILTLFSKAAYAENDAGSAYDTLENLWTAPQKEVESITAVYTQSGTVYDTDTLDSLKSDLVVTAHYSNGTSETITSYVLSGTLTEGTSTVTVSYGGKTATFTVTVSHQTETVRVLFNTLELINTVVKKDGTMATLSKGNHVVLPYYEGMFVSTLQNSAWKTNYPPFVVYDNNTYSEPTYSADSGNANHFTATLTGYSSNAVVYANVYFVTGTTAPEETCYYEYET